MRRETGSFRKSSARFPSCRSTGGRAKAPTGQPRDISRGTLEPPLGSGPYRISSVEPGRYIVYERVKDYWAKDHPVRKGTYNFDKVRYDIFLDSAVEMEAFKGDQYDFREEPAASVWAKAYDFPAVRDGRVVLEEFSNRASGRMQAYVPNLRRQKFQDERVREALNYAFDFETTNQVVSAGLHKRIDFLFCRHGARVQRPAEGQGTGDPGDRARRGAAGGLYQAVREPRGRKSEECSRQSAQGG